MKFEEKTKNYLKTDIRKKNEPRYSRQDKQRSGYLDHRAAFAPENNLVKRHIIIRVIQIFFCAKKLFKCKKIHLNNNHTNFGYLDHRAAFAPENIFVFIIWYISFLLWKPCKKPCVKRHIITSGWSKSFCTKNCVCSIDMLKCKAIFTSRIITIFFS